VTRYLARRGLRLTNRGRNALHLTAALIAVTAAVLATRGMYLAPDGWQHIPR
jgi:hypothetical protein